MKIICTSDMHGVLPNIPSCDLLLIAGDICPLHCHEIWYQRLWLENNFADWLRKVPTKNIVFIAGNHDLYFEKYKDHIFINHPMNGFLDRVHYLEDRLIEIDGLKIYGTPWQKRFHDWAFNLDEPELSQKFDMIPKCDILITHSPPYKIGDFNLRDKEHCGHQRIVDKCKEHNIKLNVYGHIHEGYGIYQQDNTTYINASYLNAQYKPVNLPIPLEI